GVGLPVIASNSIPVHRARRRGTPRPHGACMGDPAPPAWMAAAARKWLEDAGAIAEDGAGAGDGRRAFNALPLFGVRVSLAERGRAVCSLRVPAHLTVHVRPQSISSPGALRGRGRELARGGYRGGGGRRVRGGDHVGGGHHQGLRPLRHLLLRAGQAP
uniref:Uncharacterized protein n=1 Tax=Aegilops tauschii subsp. strangulata TaxID=200361 RepID=A0A453EI14_AEGTS